VTLARLLAYGIALAIVGVAGYITGQILVLTVSIRRLTRLAAQAETRCQLAERPVRATLVIFGFSRCREKR
jgi:hypothetical protein